MINVVANPVLRVALLGIGTLMVGLGIVGIYVPGLPTTPFLLLAAFCYLRSSERLSRWLLNHPRFGPGLATILREKALPLRVKVVAITAASISLGTLAVWVAETMLMKSVLVGVAAVNVVVILSIRTLPPTFNPETRGAEEREGKMADRRLPIAD
ncbi:MAG: YbaN family protein [Terriglobales bacterium]